MGLPKSADNSNFVSLVNKLLIAVSLTSHVNLASKSEFRHSITKLSTAQIVRLSGLLVLKGCTWGRQFFCIIFFLPSQPHLKKTYIWYYILTTNLAVTMYKKILTALRAGKKPRHAGSGSRVVLCPPLGQSEALTVLYFRFPAPRIGQKWKVTTQCAKDYGPRKHTFACNCECGCACEGHAWGHPGIHTSPSRF